MIFALLFLLPLTFSILFISLVGWAFADSVLHRLAPLWVGARGLEFTWDYILQGLEANANLVIQVYHLLLVFIRLIPITQNKTIFFLNV